MFLAQCALAAIVMFWFVPWSWDKLQQSRKMNPNPRIGNARGKAGIYSSVQVQDDKCYLSYGRWLLIDGNGNWVADAVTPKPIHHTLGGPWQGMGALVGKVA